MATSRVHRVETAYEQTASVIEDDLRSLDRGVRLPSERTLSERYGVSRVTIRSALAVLESRGVVAPAASRGWFVTRSPGTAAGPALGVQGFADLARARGLPATALVLDAGVRACTLTEAERLSMAPGAEVFAMRRVRYLDGQVVVVEDNRVPSALCPALAETDFTQASLFATMRAAGHVPSVAEYEVEARIATAEERELLEITDTTPVLTALQLARNQDGRPMEWTAAVYRADRYRFRGSIAH